MVRLDRLVALFEATPLFHDNLDRVFDCVAEAADLEARVVATARVETLILVRRAEAFLAGGALTTALETASAAGESARRLELPGLDDRATLVEARALVRLDRQDAAVALFRRIVARELPADQEEDVVPGLAFLAVGEAHLFEGRYEGAYGPLERSVALLPPGRECDRLRYDALVGLGMLDHRVGDFEAAAMRYGAAAALAERHGSRSERVESLLLEACLTRGLGRVDAARRHLDRALALSQEALPPERYLAFPTERLRNLVGIGDNAALVEAALDLARDCGGDGDLMGYVQLCALVATLLDLGGRGPEAVRMLAEVQAGLTSHGQDDASRALARHAAGYSGD